MKMFFNVMTSLCVSVFMYACNIFEEKQPQPRSIIFCDFTSSIDSQTSIQKIKTDALQILRTEAGERRLEFYSISKENNSNSLYYSFPLPIGAKPSDTAAFNSLAPHRDSILRLALEVASSKAALANRREPSSCIMDGVERAIGYFKNEKGHETASLRLYILSDMLECCRLNGKGKVCIEKEMLSLNKMDSVIRQFADTSLSFKSMQNLEVCIVIAASNKKESSSSALQHFWERVFKVYGYNKPLHYSPMLPVW